MHFYLEACTPKPIGVYDSSVNRILEVELLVNSKNMIDQQSFYKEKLKLPVINETEKGFQVVVGNSLMKFRMNDEVSDPVYHVAFSIPENKLEKARTWSKERFPLLRNGLGQEVMHFRKWDAHAIYFNDPAGNILEFIAHHSLKNGSDGEFTESDVLYIAEMALVSDEVRTLSKEIEQKMNMTDFIEADRKANSPDFRAIGDPAGMIILSKAARRWLMTDVYATDFTVGMKIRGDYDRKINLNNQSCIVQMVKV